MTEANLGTDGAGNDYTEVPTLSGESIRLTFVPAAKAGYGVDAVRFNIRQSSGRVRQPGPEVPVQCLPSLIAALGQLTTR